MSFKVSKEQVQAFNDDGYVIIRNFLNNQEVSKLLEVALADDVIRKNSLINYTENVPSASVEQFPFLQGQKAADILLDLLNYKNNGLEEQTACYKIIIESQLIESNKYIR